MTPRIERGQATRQRIVGTAAGLFAELGYEATSVEMVLRDSGVSRGALYHHFDSKEALFEAVLEQVEAEVADATVVASRGIADPVEALRAGCYAFLDLAGLGRVRQIVLIDAPAVVGWEKWRAIDARHGFGLLKASLAAATAQRRLSPALLEVLAHMLLAALIEIAMLIARAADPPAATEVGRAGLGELIDRLLRA
ncbi:MAG TPA: TetR/AcrR family transcriptional regulator [Candidatus Sulfotelmatobacter sp.]|nr:TetR/AcrR family transcriptional regulator [Candidatus Sulfotelmatobacter sp.]